MKMIPLLKCRDMKKALAFYTGVLDFELKYESASFEDPVVEITHGDIEIQLTTSESGSLFGSVINMRTENVDGLFEKYLARGLNISDKEGSPVHQGPVDQSWGIREFYVTDADGNTLRFGFPFDMPKAVYLNAWPYKKGHRMHLPVRDVAMAVSFYTDVLNFRKVFHSVIPVPSIILERDAVQIALAENGGDPSQEGCFFEVDDVEKALKEIRLNGVKKENAEIGIEQHGETSWRVFYLLAPDGLCYCVAQKQEG